MAEESSAQERTEAPSARKLRKAREEGQVARSTELPAAAIVIGTFLILMMSGGWMLTQLSEIFARSFVFDPKSLAQPTMLPAIFGEHLMESFGVILPVLIVTVVLAILASGLTGGYLLAFKAVLPKASKLNPISGFKRMFGMRALIELGKALIKFILVTAVLWASIAFNMETLVELGRMSLEPALYTAGKLIAQSALWVSLSLAVIALIDVPIQKMQFTKRMRMTKQEQKDEMKDVEGRPEVKAQIRRRQREMSNARMIQRVKDADVVITNPDHFSVALEYDPSGEGAPVLIAKGIDFMAEKIKTEAATHGVHVFAAPPLARALYFTTEVDQPIPEELYHAVAQVIAYVYGLEAAQPGQRGKVKPEPTVPPSMQFDAEGRRVDERGPLH